jgi:hypothetical protein
MLLLAGCLQQQSMSSRIVLDLVKDLHEQNISLGRQIDRLEDDFEELEEQFKERELRDAELIQYWKFRAEAFELTKEVGWEVAMAASGNIDKAQEMARVNCVRTEALRLEASRIALDGTQSSISKQVTEMERVKSAALRSKINSMVKPVPSDGTSNSNMEGINDTTTKGKRSLDEFNDDISSVHSELESARATRAVKKSRR